MYQKQNFLHRMPYGKNKSNFRTTITIPKSFGFEDAMLTPGPVEKIYPPGTKPIHQDPMRQTSDEMKKQSQFVCELA
jgi:hypothetical protein